MLGELVFADIWKMFVRSNKKQSPRTIKVQTAVINYTQPDM